MIKQLMNSFGIAFSMYSRIPMPACQWSQENMKYVMCFFPWIGPVIGLLCFGWSFLAQALGVNPPLRNAVLLLIPIALSGGIHLDGMLDTSDALSSWRPMEKRIEILKDSHAGAFAIMICACYFFLLYGVLDSVTMEMMPVYGAVFLVSRSFSAFSVVSFPKMKKEGTVADFSEKAKTRRIQLTSILYLLLAFLWMSRWNLWYGCWGMAGGILTFAYYYRMSVKNFGGINGDLAGWFLSVCELVMPLFMVIGDVILRI